ncbi:MAG TPA: hypothetical protein VME66_14660 [Candidatus Acidoferrales bacterium]|nr:hypothetical protein [Candidatus Acidoferrales bacterium]
MAPRDRQRLLDRALALPNAQPSDFFGGRKPPADAAPHHLKVIKDTVLRARLLGAHLAEGLQSPKGPQKIASIIRVYPDFDAPSHNGSNGRVSERAVSARKTALPTVEEMEALITRIRAVEGHVARELSLTIDHEIEQLKRRVADAKPEQLDEAYRALGAALAKRRDSSAHVREEAFRRIEADSDFAPRGYLRLLGRP